MTIDTDKLNQDPQQRWYILGAGAIGCLWACALCQAGEAVTLIVREHRVNDANKPQQQPIQFTPLDKKQSPQNYKVELMTAAQLVQNQTVDTTIYRLIIATKAYDAITALESVLPCLATNAKLLSLSNGMGMHESILAKLHDNADRQQKRQLYLGVTSDGALLSGDYQLSHTGQGETFIGEYSKPITGEKSAVESDFPAIVFNQEKFFLHTKTSDDINFRAWQKLLINCAINPLTAKYQCKNGELLSHPSIYQHLVSLCDELANIYAGFNKKNLHSGNKPLSAITAEALLGAATRVATQTMANSSSMLKDSQAGRRLELDYLNGYMVKLATSAGIGCPINHQLIADLSSNSAIIN